MSHQDLLAMASPGLLGDFGVTADNADLLNPGPELRQRVEERLRQSRTGKVEDVVNSMGREEFLEALREIVNGSDNG